MKKTIFAILALTVLAGCKAEVFEGSLEIKGSAVQVKNNDGEAAQFVEGTTPAVLKLSNPGTDKAKAVLEFQGATDTQKIKFNLGEFSWMQPTVQTVLKAEQIGQDWDLKISKTEKYLGAEPVEYREPCHEHGPDYNTPGRHHGYRTVKYLKKTTEKKLVAEMLKDEETIGAFTGVFNDEDYEFIRSSACTDRY